MDEKPEAIESNPLEVLEGFNDLGLLPGSATRRARLRATSERVAMRRIFGGVMGALIVAIVGLAAYLGLEGLLEVFLSALLGAGIGLLLAIRCFKCPDRMAYVIVGLTGIVGGAVSGAALCAYWRLDPKQQFILMVSTLIGAACGAAIAVWCEKKLGNPR
jgi:hypothetical protein